MDQSVVFVYNGGIVDVNESVHAARQKTGGLVWVEMKLQHVVNRSISSFFFLHLCEEPSRFVYFSNVIIVTLYVLHQRVFGRTVVPGSVY